MSGEDCLQLLPLEKWDELQIAFKADWPRGINGFAALHMQKLWAKQGIEYNIRVYCPFGDVNYGMVAFNEKESYYELIIQCPKNDTKKLADALINTKLINWNRYIIVPYAPRNVIECLRKVVRDIGIGLELDVHRSLETFMLEEDKFGDVRLPQGITFGLVTLDHLDLIDSTWPNRYADSPWHFRLLINTKSGFGLFLDNALISWVFMKEVGPLQHLYTVEEHRKKGYAELLMKLASKIWLQEGKPVFAFCFTENVGACELYRKLGFAQSEQVAWCYLNKKS